jgi:hydroxymethylpyrimidine/phosphomethylpyrimidine kinase
VKTALTIAGSDPTGGAGLQLDIKVFKHFGVYGLSAVSALTAQNTYEIKDIFSIDKRFMEKQLSILLSDIRPDAIKTGMLFSTDVVKTVVKFIKGLDLQNVIIDPVTVSSTGTTLLEEDALKVLIEELFPLSTVITPNIYEASIISGINILTEEDMEKAAIELKKLGPENVIITGGHFREVRSQRTEDRKQKTDNIGGDETLDLIYDGERFYRISGKRIRGEYHGTGCAYSAALTACIAKGLSLIESARKAKTFVEESIKNAYSIGKGMRLLHV